MATKQKQHKVWSQKHYNAIASEIRELFPSGSSNWEHLNAEDHRRDRIEVLAQRGILSALALSLAVRFKQDSDEAERGGPFDPIKFLDACSPDVDLYRLSELWENYE